MQIKTTVIYFFTPSRIAVIKTPRKCKCCQGCGEIRPLVHGWWACKLTQSLWKAVWQFLKKLNVELPRDPTAPVLGMYTKGLKAGSLRGTCTPSSYRLHSQQRQVETTQMFTGRWMESTHTVECYSTFKKSEILPHATTLMNFENIVPRSEMSQTKKDKYRTTPRL